MRAVILKEFGGPENLEHTEMEKPAVGPGQLLVKVIASGTNPVEAKVRKNGKALNLQTPLVLGYDAAGIVEEVGSGVNDFSPGDEVYYTPEIAGNQLGTYAEYNTVPRELVAKKPEGISFEAAAAIPLAGGTAWEAVIRRLQIRPGETILIHGAAGGVGSFATQFARAAGARIIATASPGNHELLRQLGADVVVDYHKQDAAEVALAETGGAGVDAAFDIQGENVASRCLSGVKPFGRIAVILPPSGDFTALYQKNITLYGVFLTREQRRLEEMRPLFERGQVQPIIDEILSLDEAEKAHKRLDSGHGRGKIVLRVSEA